MSEPYFWPFGDCKRCGWKSHMRQDYPEKRTLFRHRLVRPARSVVWCHNCRIVTALDPSPAARDNQEGSR